MSIAAFVTSAYADIGNGHNSTNRSAYITYAVVIARWTDGQYGIVKYLISYSAVAGAVIALHTCRQLMYSYVGMKASQSLHSELLKSLLGATLAFFAATPSGAIMSRFSADFAVIDGDLIDYVASVADSFLGIFTCLGLVIILSPYYVIMVIPLSAAYIWIQSCYRPASKALKREDAAAKGPLYSHFYETINGLEVIRGFRIHQKLIEMHHELLDNQIEARVNWDAVNRWLGLNLDLVGVAIVFSAALCLSFDDNISGGFAGLLLSYAMRTTQNLSFAIRSSTALENAFVSPERGESLMPLRAYY